MEFTAQLDVDVVALEAEDEVTCLVSLTAPGRPNRERLLRRLPNMIIPRHRDCTWASKTRGVTTTVDRHLRAGRPAFCQKPRGLSRHGPSFQ